MTRALCARGTRLAASGVDRGEERGRGPLERVGSGDDGRVAGRTSTDAGCKHELLQARNVTALVDALLKNEALAATRRRNIGADADLVPLEEHEERAVLPADLGARDLEAAAGEQDAARAQDAHEAPRVPGEPRRASDVKATTTRSAASAWRD